MYGQEKWFTDCQQVISVEEETYYQFSFFEKSYNTTDTHAKVLWFNTTEIDEVDDYCQVDYVVPNYEDVEGKWSRTEELLLSPAGAKTAVVWFGANRVENLPSTAVYVDDVEFYKVERTLEIGSQLFNDIQSINYSKISPTKYVASLNLKAPCVVAFSEAYNPSWACYADNERISPFILYDSINGFYVNNTGSVPLTIEYAISLITLVCSASFLLILVRKKITKFSSVLSQKVRALVAATEKR